jgi:hypothetical protein
MLLGRVAARSRARASRIPGEQAASGPTSFIAGPGHISSHKEELRHLSHPPSSSASRPFVPPKSAGAVDIRARLAHCPRRHGGRTSEQARVRAFAATRLKSLSNVEKIAAILTGI